MNILNGYLYQILLALILAFCGILGSQIKKLYTKYVNTEIKQAVARTAVRFVEQVYRDLHGEAKLKEAIDKAVELLAVYGITITETELVALLEAAVNEFNNSFGKLTSEAA